MRLTVACSHTRVSDMTSLPASLRTLEASHSDVTDESVRQIHARCPALYDLGLSATALTDDIVPVVEDMLMYVARRLSAAGEAMLVPVPS